MSGMVPSHSRRRVLIAGACYVASTPLIAMAATDAPIAERNTVLFLAKTLGNPYFREMEDGVVDAARKVPLIRLESRAGKKEDDVSGQRQILESYLLHARPRHL